MKQRLDQFLVQKGLTSTRSQAESFIKLGEVEVNGQIVTKPGYFIDETAIVKFLAGEKYVSRAGLKLASIAALFELNFTNKVVLDVGSSTGGFTDYALQHGARKVIAVDVGTNQLHSDLLGNPKIELHEQTDIRDMSELSNTPDIVVIDVSFISLREVLPHIAKLCSPTSQVVAMLKPQFEAGTDMKHRGVIKNDRLRREILKGFEGWIKDHFVIRQKADSRIAGSKGNVERFYLLKPVNSSS